MIARRPVTGRALPRPKGRPEGAAGLSPPWGEARSRASGGDHTSSIHAIWIKSGTRISHATACESVQL